MSTLETNLTIIIIFLVAFVGLGVWMLTSLRRAIEDVDWRVRAVSEQIARAESNRRERESLKRLSEAGPLTGPTPSVRPLRGPAPSVTVRIEGMDAEKVARAVAKAMKRGVQ